jgi:CBS domain-containing protein
MGSLEQPLNPLAVALSAEATFVARSVDSNVRHLAEVLGQAAAHQGTSFVEIYQNCVIFNGNEWDDISDRKIRDDNLLFLEHGQPLVFGKDKNKGIALRNGYIPEVVDLGNGTKKEDLLVHDAHTESSHLAYLLSRVEQPAIMGVFRNVQRPTYTDGMVRQVEEAQAKKGKGDLNQLYRSADLWEVGKTEVIESNVAGTISPELDEEYVDELDRNREEPTEMQDHLDNALISILNPNVPITVEEHTSLANSIRIMKSHNIGCLLVTDVDGRLTGVFTERDVLNRIACQVDDLTRARVVDFMTPEPFALKKDMPIKHALHLMSLHEFRHLPLVDDDFKPEGVISFRDVVHHLKERLA